MAVRIVFLGKLADLASAGELELRSPDRLGRADWQRYRARLAEAVQGERVKVALNGAVLADKTQLAASDGDEIALLPPVSGGLTWRRTSAC